MKKIIYIIIMLGIMVPSVCMADTNLAKKVTIGLGVSAFSFQKFYIDSHDYKMKEFNIGNVDSSFTIGYTFTELIEFGGQIRFLLQNIETSHIAFGLAPYLKFNFRIGEKVILPLTFSVGYEVESYPNVKQHLGSVGMKQGLDYLVNDILSLGPYVFGKFRIGKYYYDNDYDEDYTVKHYEIGLGFGLTFWI